MNENHKDHGALERCVDDLMPDSERAAFEERVRRDPELARELAQQTELERRLRRIHGPPTDVDAVAERVLERAGVTTHTGAAGSPVRRVAVAAAIVLILAAAVRWRSPLGSCQADGGLTRLAAGPLYSEVAASPLADPSCGLPSTLGREVAERCVGAVDCEEESANIPVAVVPYPAWPTATVLFGRQAEQLVVVVIDALERDPAPVDTSDLNVHRRAFGGFVLYEVTPFERPYLLTQLSGDETE